MYQLVLYSAQDDTWCCSRKNSLGNNVAGLPLSDLEVFPGQEGAAYQDDCYSESLAARTTPV